MSSPERIEPRIRMAPVGELRVWPVYEHELDALAQGAPGSILLNFSLALLPTSLTLLLTLLTVQIDSVKIYATYVSLCAVAFIAGLVCLALWFQFARQSQNLIEQIKQRMPRIGEQEIDESQSDRSGSP